VLDRLHPPREGSRRVIALALAMTGVMAAVSGVMVGVYKALK
jgi:hypothetical protein